MITHGPSVSVWCGLRHLDHADDEAAEKARQATNIGDWVGFIEAMNGPCAKRADQLIKTAECLEFYRETGEYLDGTVNQHGEPAKGKPFGMLAHDWYWITRTLRWEIKRPKKAESEINPGSSWLDRLKQLTQVREPTETEIAALPDDVAYEWEKLSGEVQAPATLEFCQ